MQRRALIAGDSSRQYTPLLESHGPGKKREMAIDCLALLRNSLAAGDVHHWMDFINAETKRVSQYGGH
jgi:hypothetical protein